MVSRANRDPVCQRLIDAMPEGAVTLAKICGLAGRQAPSQWKRLPARHVLTIERATGIPRWELRPDLYPPHEYHPKPKKADGTHTGPTGPQA